MKRLVVSQSLVEVESLKEFLSADGILCTIRNQQGSSLAGEVPFVEVFPELWVVSDADFDRAKELLEEQGSGDEVERPMWVCAGCGERHVGLFTACWKCGRENDAKSEAPLEKTKGSDPVELSPPEYATVLNEFGAGGWELVAVSMGDMTEPRLIFKK